MQYWPQVQADPEMLEHILGMKDGGVKWQLEQLNHGDENTIKYIRSKLFAS